MAPGCSNLNHRIPWDNWLTTSSGYNISWNCNGTSTTVPVTASGTNYVTLNTQQVLPTPSGTPLIVRPASVPEAFNKYVNASDLLEEFFKYLGDLKVREREMRELPMDLFIKWLVIRACEEDKEEPGVALVLPAPKVQLRCIQCRRFKALSPVPFDRAICASRYMEKAA